MIRNKTISLAKVIIAFISLFLTLGYIEARINLNGSGAGYETDPPKTEELYTELNSIERYVEDAAGNFLLAHSEILYFSNLYELSSDSCDFDQWHQILDDADKHVQSTKSIYCRLIAVAENTPYYQPVIDRLKVFDYRGFQSKNNLNKEIFEEVEGFLKNGDINGVYREALRRIEEIEVILGRIIASVNVYVVPELSHVWLLNEVCSSKLMFGQYVAMVFFNLD